MIKKRVFLIWILIAGFIANPVLADGPAPVVGKSYMAGSCEGFLEAVITEGVSMESYFVGRVRDEQQALQLLQDYGFIFTRQFQDALLLALGDTYPKLNLDQQRINEIFSKNEDDKKDEIHFVDQNRGYGKRLLSALKQTLLASDDKFRVFTNAVLSRMENLSTMDENPIRAESQNLRIHNFLVAMKASPQKALFENAMGTFIKVNILYSARWIVNRMYPNYMKQFRKSISFGTVLSNSVMFVLSGLISAEVVQQIYDSYTYDQTPGQIGGLVGGLAFVGLWRGKSFLTQPRFRISSSMIRRLMADRPDFLLEGPNGVPKSTTVNNLFNAYTRTLDAQDVTLEAACKVSSICELSPVQIAYLGHLDVLEMEALGTTVQQDLGKVGFKDGFDRLYEAAESLRSSGTGGNFRQRMVFRQKMQALTENYAFIEKNLTTSIAKLTAKLGEINAAIAKLREKPYNFQSQQFSDDLLLKGEMLEIKLETDLDSLTEIKVHQEELLARIHGLKPYLDQFEAILSSASGSNADWSKLAGQVMITLDQVRQSHKQ